MRQRPQDMREVAGLLDETIAKAERIEQRELAAPLRKSLSFNPAEPHEMGAESTYYNPYRTLSDGSYAPHAPGYWMEQAGAGVDGDMGPRILADETPEQLALRRDGYREVDHFLRMAGVMKAVLDVEIDELVKAAASPKSKKPLGHAERLAAVKHHIKKRKAKDKLEKDKALDKRIKEHVDGNLAEHFETYKIQQKVHATMQKRLGEMGPNQRSQLHQVASGLGRPATPEETKWSGMPPKSRAKQKPTSPGL